MTVKRDPSAKKQILTSARPPLKWPLRYQLYYDPEFEYALVTYAHVESCRRLSQYIEYLRLSIESDGLKNPVQVHWLTDSPHIHPGKSRVAALESLGQYTVPAIIVTKEYFYKPSKTAIPIKPEDAQSYLSGDCVAEYCHRFFNIKKRPNG